MKNLVFSFILIAAFTGCDKVDLARDPAFTGNDPSPELVRRKVLLEDYTGHTCGNCPGAAEVAGALQKKYGDDLIVIAVHAGHFSKTSSKYPTSYTTTVGNDWNLEFIGPNGLYPNGTVNRTDYSGGGIMSKETKWAASVDLAFQEPRIVDLVLDRNYDKSSRTLDISVKGLFETSYDRNLNLSVVLLEDGIVGPQTDYRIEGHLVPNYVFDHMLRDAVNGSWGTPFTQAPVAAGDSVVANFSGFNVNTAFVEDNLTVVAFVYDSDSREVIEAEKIPLKTKLATD